MGNQQRGGTLLGLIIGVILGLGIGLGVAVYVTKMPVPFKGDPRSADDRQGDSERYRNWNPNAPLTGAQPERGAAPAAPEVQPSAPATSAQNPLAQPPAVSADPLGDLAHAQLKAAEAKAAAEAAAANDGFHYFVQAGAFRSKADADAQRAKLAMMGWEARISEREQNGRVVFRVRMGPFDKRGDAAQLKQRLDDAGIDSSMVRVQQ